MLQLSHSIQTRPCINSTHGSIIAEQVFLSNGMVINESPHWIISNTIIHAAWIQPFMLLKDRRLTKRQCKSFRKIQEKTLPLLPVPNPSFHCFVATILIKKKRSSISLYLKTDLFFRLSSFTPAFGEIACIRVLLHCLILEPLEIIFVASL